MAAGTKGSGPKWVGRAIRRLEDPALVTGRGRFTADLPATHWVRFVRSPVASGRIVAIDAPRDAQIFGATDLKDTRPIRPMLHKFNYQPIEQPLLAKDVVRFVGEPIAVVVASSPAEAEDLADAVSIEIDALPAVIDAQDALRPDAPRVHAGLAGNVVVESRFATADFAATMAGAHRLIEVTLRSRRQNATPLEARGAHAVFDRATGRVTLTCATQMPHLLRTAVADVLGMPESDLRVVAPDVGGGFGQKMSLPAEYAVLVWLSRRLTGSVAWSEDRRENLIASFHSRDQCIYLEGAFAADGKLVALSADVLANIGAYSCFPTTCGVEPLMAAAELPGPYDVRAYRLRRARRCDPYLHDGALSRRVAPGHHRSDRAADGQGSGRVRLEPGRNPPAQSDRALSLHLRYRSRFRRRQLSADTGASRRHCRPAGVPPAAERGAQPRHLSRHRLCGILRTHRLWQPRLRGARHGDHAGLGACRDRDGPVRARRGAYRREPARPGTAHHAGADHRRRDRRVAAGNTRRARRHRSHALWLGHVRQPLAGHRRRRIAPGGAQSPVETFARGKPHAGGGGSRHRARERARQSLRHRSRGADRRAGARCLSSDPQFQGRDQPRPA